MSWRILTLCVALVLTAPLAGCRKRRPAPPDGAATTAPADAPGAADRPALSLSPGGLSLREADPPVCVAATAPATRPSVAAARKAVAGQEFDESKWRQLRTARSEPATSATAEHDSETDTHIAAGVRALQRGDSTVAAACFRRAFSLDPAHMGALYGLSEALLSDGQYRQAVPVCEMIVGMNPDDHVSRFNLAVVLSRLRQFHRAEKTYRDLLIDDEDNIRARYNLATLYQAQGKLADARDSWKRVAAATDMLPSAYTALAEVYLDLGDAQSAMTAYAAAAKARPMEVAGWLNLAAASQAAGYLGRAVVAQQRAAELAPNDADIWATLGHLKLELHRTSGDDQFLAGAVQAWRRNLELDPSRQDIRDWLATYEPSLAETKPARPTQAVGQAAR